MTRDSLLGSNLPALQAAIRRLPGPIFAVVDGSWFENVPALLGAASFRHRSLFRDEGDADVLKAGPWLVDLSGPSREGETERLLGVLASQPATVFWSCTDGEAALYRHLRSINEVLIPQQDDASESISDSSGIERVVFRHWDPRVFASIVPLLDEGQAARLLGPAEGVALDSGYGRGAGAVLRPAQLPAIMPGPLRFTSEQIAALDDEHMERFRLETAEYLREHCVDQTTCLDDDALYRVVYSAEESARRFGLRDGPDLRRWAWLWMMTEGYVGTDADVRTFMTDQANGPRPTDRLERLWEETLQGFDEVESPSEKL